ncbi:MAG: type II toxin-antitoxin system RelE/ParE family toxin [Agrobacterium vaccinii]
MSTFEKSHQFDSCLKALKGTRGKVRILHRVTAAENGNFGDWKPVGEGVSEMRINFGPGYRLYYTRRGETVCLLLIGGDKSTQKRDIQKAIEMARTIGKE